MRVPKSEKDLPELRREPSNDIAEVRRCDTALRFELGGDVQRSCFS